MNEMMSYVFGTLQRNEATLANLVKVVNKQASNISLWVLACVGYVIVAENRHKDQNKKIKQLKEELDALTSKQVEAEVDEP